MSDDLTAARRFCDTVRSDMSSLIEGVCAQPCAEADVLIGSLVRIQSGAKRMHARAIFRAAQTVVNAVNDRAALPSVQGRILSLNKLITQYEMGLSDIAPRPANGESADLAPEANKTAPDTLDKRYADARAALAPLMQFAKPGVERDSLSALSGFKTGEITSQETVDPNQGLVSDETPLDASSAASLPSAPRSAPAFTNAQNVAIRPLDFEILMPSFITHALQEARQTDKTVSVSYAADGVSLSACQVPALQNTLNHIAKTFVRSVLERPETRRGRGDSGAGHIALTAAQTQDTLSISIECPGTTQSISAFLPDGPRTEGLIITPGQNAAEGFAHIVLTCPRKSLAASSAASTPQSAEMAS